MAGVLRSTRWWMPLLIILVGAMVSRYGVKHEWFSLPNDFRHPFCIMDFFVPGIAVAILLQNEKVKLWLQSRKILAMLALVGAALVGWALYRHYSVALRVDDTRFQGFRFYLAFETMFLKQRSSVLFYQPALAFGTALLLLVLWMRPSLPAKWLRYTPLPWMGKISYSTYLWHMMVVFCFARGRWEIPKDSFWEEPWAFFTLVIASVYGLSAVAWHFLEKPFLNQRLAGPESPPHEARLKDHPILLDIGSK
jgi:peptidoglycan/LPS O-acetylase OafA/YrhL